MMRPVHIDGALIADMVREGWRPGSGRSVRCVRGVPPEAMLASIEVSTVTEPITVILWFSYDEWETSDPIIVEYESGPEAKPQP